MKPETHPATAQPAPCGALAHPEIRDLIERAVRLDATAALTAREENLLVWNAATLETLGSFYWLDFVAISGQPLPDPGVRPQREAMAPYADRPRDFERALGFVHRVREYIERAEIKYSAPVASLGGWA